MPNNLGKIGPSQDVASLHLGNCTYSVIDPTNLQSAEPEISRPSNRVPCMKSTKDYFSGVQ